MDLKPYLLHPAAVHFPIALLAAGMAAAAARLKKGSPAWLSDAETWLLWCGTAFAWLALGLGLLAEKTAPHVPPAWEVLADHETLAWWTVSVFTALSALRFYVLKTGRDAGKWRAIQWALWIAGITLILATAEHGGELVFKFGMGVVAE